jgi:hypothetical protein
LTRETEAHLQHAAANVRTAINSPQKNMSNFKTWTHENLAEFAYQANIKMIQQNERIEELQRDLKDAIEAYRGLNRQIQPDVGKGVTGVDHAHRDVALK